jgi:hypothetical protein
MKSILAFTAILLSATFAAAQITIGPITLGRPTPALPECIGVPSQGAPCTRMNGSQVWNVPYDGGYLFINRGTGTIISDIEDRMCPGVLARLVEKFGQPRVISVNQRNAFGAVWSGEAYEWPQSNGDDLRLYVHIQRVAGCDLLAETAAAIAASSSAKVKF